MLSTTQRKAPLFCSSLVACGSQCHRHLFPVINWLQHPASNHRRIERIDTDVATWPQHHSGHCSHGPYSSCCGTPQRHCIPIQSTVFPPRSTQTHPAFSVDIWLCGCQPNRSGRNKKPCIARQWSSRCLFKSIHIVSASPWLTRGFYCNHIPSRPSPTCCHQRSHRIRQPHQSRHHTDCTLHDSRLVRFVCALQTNHCPGVATRKLFSTSNAQHRTSTQRFSARTHRIFCISFCVARFLCPAQHSHSVLHQPHRERNQHRACHRACRSL